MKKNDRTALRSAPVAELEKNLKEARGRFYELTIELRAGKLKDVHERTRVRRDIARFLTALRTRRNEEQKAS